MTTYFFSLLRYMTMKFPSPYNFIFLIFNNCLLFSLARFSSYLPLTSSSSYSQNSVKLLPLQTNTQYFFCFFFFLRGVDNLHEALCPPFLSGLVILQAYCTTVLKLLFIITLRYFLPSSTASFLFSASFIFPFHGYIFFFNEVYLPNIDCKGGKFFKTMYI